MSDTTDAFEQMASSFDDDPSPRRHKQSGLMKRVATKITSPPTFWTSGLAKALVGDQPCLLSIWLPSHQEIVKVRRDESALARWKVAHTELLTATTKTYRAAGWKCSVESFFRVTGSAAILSGKADLIAQKPEERPLIVDVKSGESRDSDVAQVMIEQIAVPLAWSSPSMIFNGRVVYEDHSVDVTPAEAQSLKPKLFALLRKLGSDDRPPANPSQSACRFCHVGPTDCPERWVDQSAAEVTTLEF